MMCGFFTDVAAEYSIEVNSDCWPVVIRIMAFCLNLGNFVEHKLRVGEILGMSGREKIENNDV
jgi:hypothetical protein